MKIKIFIDKFIELSKDKYKSKIALVIILIAILTGEYRLLGVVFLYWVINDFIKQETYLIDPIQRVKNPFLYWMVLAIWVAFTYFTFTTIYYY